MRILFIVVFLANVVLTAASLVVLPAEVAIHFGANGEPNGWASKEMNALVFFALELPLFFVLYFSPRFIKKVPRKLLNLPNKDYWLAEENLPVFTRKLSSLAYEYGVAIFGFLILTGILTIEANLSDPVKLREDILIIGLVVFLAYTGWWCFKFYRDFRIPRAEETFPDPNT